VAAPGADCAPERDEEEMDHRLWLAPPACRLKR
jgi:hypothetical protein